MANILSLGTAAAPHLVKQAEVSKALSSRLKLDKERQKKLHSIFQKTEIEKRYSVVKDYQHPQLQGELFDKNFPEVLPGTSKRNEIYKREAPKLAHAAAEKALKTWGGDRSEITHVISVSCTGLVAPGIEFSLVDSLSLSRSVHRLGINFMGCFGAFQGLATARAFALENPNHRVLLVCTELCSLHMQIDDDLKTFVVNALFSDGSGAAVVGMEARGKESPLWSIAHHHSLALTQSLRDMTWEIGDDGCIMNLSQQVPIQVKRHIKEFVKALWKNEEVIPKCDWLVHPGGKAILQAVADVCQLDPIEDLKPSWDVLRNYGNMSSATFLFILDAARKQQALRKWGIGLGFGPGLSLEGILLKNEQQNET